MSVVTIGRSRRDARPGPLARLVLDPVGRPKPAVRWAIAVAAIAAFAVAFAVSANAPQVRGDEQAAPTTAARTAVLSAPDGTAPGIGSLRRLARLPALARAPHRRHHRATHRRAAATPTKPTATPTPAATPVPTTAPVVTARPRSTPSVVFDTSG